MRTLTFAEALAEGMAEEMRRDHRVVLMGIDIGPYGGAFAATRGLYEEFGPERIIDMPVSEAGYTGCGVGAAATGLRPVVELQFSDWITIASDQLINQAANMRYMFGGEISIPMVLRAPVGGYLSAAAQHSHMFESMFSFIARLKVVLPSSPHDAKGLIKSAIRDNNPVIFFEHKKLYEETGPVPAEDYVIPLGKAGIKRPGKDVTLVTYAYMVGKSLAAAEKLGGEGIDVEVVDLRSVSPIDEDAIVASVKKTHRLVVVQESPRSFGVASEVIAQVNDRSFLYLEAPVKRVTGWDVVTPYFGRENLYIPGADRIRAGIEETLDF